jgi:cobalt/nickel transport system permease protein
MHISEGILSLPVLAGGGFLSIIGTAVGLKKLDYDRIMPVSILAATFFVASLIHVPLVTGSVHLILNGLLGLILGWASFPAIMTALLLQAIFFQYGGILVLGVNTFNMAFPALFCFYILRPFLRRQKYRAFAGFAGGFFSVFMTALLMALSLIISDPGLFSSANIIILSHLPVMFIEGIVSMFTVSFVARVKPEILQL